MKRSILILGAMVILIGAQAQKKPKINQANNAWANGDLVKAKEIIDAAIEHEKTKDDGKTWYYRALIYATIDTIDNPQYAEMKVGALEEASTAFEKAEELGDPNKLVTYSSSSPIPILMSQQLEGYYSFYFNKGVEGFQVEDFDAAIENFVNASAVMKKDTNAIKNAAYAAHSAQLLDQAISYYQTSIERGAEAEDLYVNLLSILVATEGREDEALAFAKEARAKFPTNSSIPKTEINLLIKMDKVEEAKENLISAIEAEPDNPNLHFTLASMYEELDQEDKALETYTNALEADPNHFESNFNRGVILLNRANEVYKEYSDLGISKADQKKAKTLEPKIKEKFGEALPQWEKLYEIRPNDAQVVETLAYVYQRVGNRAKANELAEKLEGM